MASHVVDGKLIPCIAAKTDSKALLKHVVPQEDRLLTHTDRCKDKTSQICHDSHTRKAYCVSW